MRSVLYPQCLVECLTPSRCSINESTKWMNKWTHPMPSTANLWAIWFKPRVQSYVKRYVLRKDNHNISCSDHWESLTNTAFNTEPLIWTDVCACADTRTGTHKHSPEVKPQPHWKFLDLKNLLTVIPSMLSWCPEEETLRTESEPCQKLFPHRHRALLPKSSA